MLSEVKRCPACETEKAREAFWKQSSSVDGLQAHCKECSTAKTRAWRAANVIGQRTIQRRGKLWDTYGLTPDDYDRLFAQQGGRCAICNSLGGGVSKDFPLDVDHCHSTGKVRGLLCSTCNRGMGQLKDSPERLRAAAAYLEACEPSEVVAVCSTG